jgi:hypothetical protein
MDIQAQLVIHSINLQIQMSHNKFNVLLLDNRDIWRKAAHVSACTQIVSNRHTHQQLNKATAIRRWERAPRTAKKKKEKKTWCG